MIFGPTNRLLYISVQCKHLCRSTVILLIFGHTTKIYFATVDWRLSLDLLVKLKFHGPNRCLWNRIRRFLGGEDAPSVFAVTNEFHLLVWKFLRIWVTRRFKTNRWWRLKENGYQQSSNLFSVELFSDFHHELYFLIMQLQHDYSFQVCRLIPSVWPFKWKLVGCSCMWYCLFFNRLKNENH